MQFGVVAKPLKLVRLLGIRHIVFGDSQSRSEEYCNLASNFILFPGSAYLLQFLKCNYLVTF